MNEQPSYRFATPAVYQVPIDYFSAGMAFFKGTLGLTTNGRLEFVLQSGQIIFSAPVSQLQCKVRTLLGVITIQLNTQQFTVQYVQKHDQVAGNVYEEWQRLLEQYRTFSSDDQSVITSYTPNTMRMTLIGYGLIAVLGPTAFFGSYYISQLNAATPGTGDTMGGLLIIGLLIVPLIIWRHYFLRATRRKILASPSRPQHTTISAH